MRTALALLMLSSTCVVADTDMWRLVQRPTAPQAPALLFQMPPTPSMPQVTSSNPRFILHTGWEGPIETGFPGPAYRVPGPGRTAKYIDPIGRAWYMPGKPPYPVIEMPKSFDAEKHYREVIYPKLKAQGVNIPPPK